MQEAGRAGRDGKLSHCTMYISEDDMSRTKFFATQSSNPISSKEARAAKEAKVKSFETLVKYCTDANPKCRQTMLMQGLGDVVDPEFKCNNCDVCTDMSKVVWMVRKYKIATARGSRGFGTTAVTRGPSNRYDTTLTEEADGSDSDGDCVDHESMQSR